MKIKETIERECCESRDLKPVLSSKMYGKVYSLAFCIYCGARHKYRSFMDAAGSTDWTYDKLEEEKE